MRARHPGPTQVTNFDWDDMCARLAAYAAEHGDADVAKKYQPDPKLGGWVAAVRRLRQRNKRALASRGRLQVGRGVFNAYLGSS